MSPLRLSLLSCLLVVAACTIGSSPPAEPLWEDGAGDREIVDVGLTEEWRLGGEEDTLLLRPGWLVARQDGLQYLETADQRLVSLDESGAVRWATGSEGEGPGQFQIVRGAAALPDGGATLYDVGNSRITVFGPDGQIASMTRIPSSVADADGAVSVGEGRFALVTYAPDKPFVVVHDDRVASRAEMPWEAFSNLHILDRQGEVVSDGEDWAYLFDYGNGFFAFRGAEPLDYLGQFVEHVPFPRLLSTSTASTRTTTFERPPVCAACSAALSDGVLYVLFGGYTEDSGKVIDRYEFESGTYLSSFRVPEHFKELSIQGDRLYGLLEDPYPVLYAYRFNPDTP